MDKILKFPKPQDRSETDEFISLFMRSALEELEEQIKEGSYTDTSNYANLLHMLFHAFRSLEQDGGLKDWQPEDVQFCLQLTRQAISSIAKTDFSRCDILKAIRAFAEQVVGSVNI